MVSNQSLGDEENITVLIDFFRKIPICRQRFGRVTAAKKRVMNSFAPSWVFSTSASSFDCASIATRFAGIAAAPLLRSVIFSFRILLTDTAV